MSTPRRHHFVPKFYLKGFTKESSVDGRLWAVDVTNGKSWQSTPAKSALECDFYKGDLGSDVDPMWLERMLAESVELQMAQVLDFVLDTKAIPPCGAAHDVFLNLVAISLVRGPAMRTMNSMVFDEGMKRQVGELASSEEGNASLQKALEESGLSLGDFTALNDQGAFQYDFDRITHLKAFMEQFNVALDAFARRNWTARLVANDAPDLVCSDAPVGMIPLAEEVPLLWFDPHVLVVMPLNRRIAALGSMEDVEQPDTLDMPFVARINASIASGATQVYCSESAFTTTNGKQFQRVELSA